MGQPPGKTVWQLLRGLESRLEKRKPGSAQKPEREHPQQHYSSRPKRGNNSNARQRMKRENIHTMECYPVTARNEARAVTTWVNSVNTAE